MKLGEPRNDSLVVAEEAITVQRHEIREKQCNKVLGIRPLGMSRNLRALPRPEVRVEFPAQFSNLLADALYFGIGIPIAR
jgi:hypothetical protein